MPPEADWYRNQPPMRTSLVETMRSTPRGGGAGDVCRPRVPASYLQAYSSYVEHHRGTSLGWLSWASLGRGSPDLCKARNTGADGIDGG